MRGAYRGLLLAVFAVAVCAGPAVASTMTTASPDRVVVFAQSALAVNSAHQAGPTTAPTAPPGPNLNQQIQTANNNQAKHKLAVGIAAVLLLVIVYFGRRIRNRHNRRLKNLQNAKA